MSKNRSKWVKLQGIYNILWIKIPTAPSKKKFHYTLKMYLLFSVSLNECNNSAVTSYSTVFHSHIQLRFNKVWLKEESCSLQRGWHIGAGVRGSRVTKGVIIPQGVAYCCLSLCDKTKPTRLGSIAVCLRFHSGAWQYSDKLFKAS